MPLNDEYFIFGGYWGECDGNCAQIYLLQAGKLYPDNMESLKTDLIFKGSALPEYKCNYAKILKDNFPSYLKTIPPGVIGDPDSRDQGGIVIEWKEKGTAALRWYIDIDHAAIPQQIWPFIDQVQSAVVALR